MVRLGGTGWEREVTEEDGFRLEAAEQFGFSQAEDDGPYTCTEAQLIAFAKACERKGLAEAHGLANRDAVHRRILDIDTELAPIMAAEEERSMLAAGYVRGTDEPGKRWVKPSELLCDDEGCPHHGTEHVCVNRTALIGRLKDCIARLEENPTLPAPYDFYYAIKNKGQGTGWRYECVGIGIQDVRDVLVALDATPQWRHRVEDTDFPEVNGWYRVMVAGDSESIDGHTIYEFDDYETWAQFTSHEDGGSFVGQHDEDEHTIFAYCGPFAIPEYVPEEIEIERELCEYCGPCKSTGLPGNACENCMNTGLKNPTAEDLK